MVRRIGWLTCATLVLGGCLSTLKSVESGDGDDGSACLVADSGDGWRCSPIWLSDRKLVDILFVIDNSGSMAEEQGRLAASIDALVDPLEAAGVDYRIGVTTTDNSNPWCGDTTSPEAGALVMSSCRGRLEHFVFGGTGWDPPADDIACTDHCALESEQLDALMKPTRTDVDPDAKLRPWIQSGPLDTNLPEGVSGVEALRCVLPQGIDGCGFESQLESMYKAVQRTRAPAEVSYGFIRDEAVLAIVILTDEADCSYAPDGADIFAADGNRVFWSDPDAQYPTSAVCWNAGVECTGGPGTYDECHAADKDLDGALTDDPERAVLQPLSRYLALIRDLQEDKRALDPENDVLVAVIAGVPDDLGELVYADDPDPVFQGDFGIGPGCQSADGLQTAIPPVRMRALEESLGMTHLYSVCADDYAPALTRLAEDIESHMRTLCHRACVADLDPDAPGVQPDCLVTQETAGQPQLEVPSCSTENGAFVLPSADDDVCFGVLTDPAQMSAACVEGGWNLEFAIVRRPGVPVPGGTVLLPVCQLSEDPFGDCPGLGG